MNGTYFLSSVEILTKNDKESTFHNWESLHSSRHKELLSIIDSYTLKPGVETRGVDEFYINFGFIDQAAIYHIDVDKIKVREATEGECQPVKTSGCGDPHAVTDEWNRAAREVIPSFPFFDASEKSKQVEESGYGTSWDYSAVMDGGVIPISDWDDPSVWNAEKGGKPHIIFSAKWHLSYDYNGPKTPEKMADLYQRVRDNAKACGDRGWDIREGAFGEKSCIGSYAHRGTIDLSMASDPYGGYGKLYKCLPCADIYSEVSIQIFAPPSHGSRNKPEVIRALNESAREYAQQIGMKLMAIAEGAPVEPPPTMFADGSGEGSFSGEGESTGQAQGGKVPVLADAQGSDSRRGSGEDLPLMGYPQTGVPDVPPEDDVDQVIADAIASLREQGGGMEVEGADVPTGGEMEGRDWKTDDLASYESDDDLLFEGEELMAQGRFREAAEAYETAIRRNPDNPEYRVRYGDVHILQGNWREAEVAYRNAIEIDSSRAEYHALLGESLVEQSRWREAEAAYREAIRLEPDHPGHHGMLGLILMEQGREQEGEAALKKAEELESQW